MSDSFGQQYLLGWIYTAVQRHLDQLALYAHRNKGKWAHYTDTVPDHDITPEDVRCVLDALTQLVKEEQDGA